MTDSEIHQLTPRPQDPRNRRGLLIGAAAAALVIIVGVGAFAFIADDGTNVAGSGDVETGPVTSFEDIAGTYQHQGLGPPVFFHFFEDGTFHRSENRDLVEDRPSSITETRFEGTKVFLTETKGVCDDDPDAIYEIHLLENGNLQFVGVDEDPCRIRSTLDGSEWTLVP
jgi:hypothetical protein